MNLNSIIGPNTSIKDIKRTAEFQACNGKVLTLGRGPTETVLFYDIRGMWAVKLPGENYPTYTHSTRQAVDLFVDSWHKA